MRIRLLLLPIIALFVAGAASAPIAPTPSQQLFMLKEVTGGLSNVAVIWDGDGDATTLERVQRAAASHGIELLLARVDAARDVGPAFRELTRTHNAEAIWIVTDTGVPASEPSKSFILREATLAGIPLLAPNETWVREGATLAVLEGAEGVRLAVNKPSADALSLQIPESYATVTDFLAAR